MNRFYLWLRNKRKKRLFSMYISGARVAHLPPFLDRYPTPGRYHRAEESAFMRGFLAEQRAMRDN